MLTLAEVPTLTRVLADVTVGAPAPVLVPPPVLVRAEAPAPGHEPTSIFPFMKTRNGER
jgi:hypothetical protein